MRGWRVHQKNPHRMVGMSENYFLRGLRLLDVILGIFERSHAVWLLKVAPVPSTKSRIAHVTAKSTAKRISRKTAA